MILKNQINEKRLRKIYLDHIREKSRPRAVLRKFNEKKKMQHDNHTNTVGLHVRVKSGIWQVQVKQGGKNKGRWERVGEKGNRKKKEREEKGKYNGRFSSK